jgi:hypothetical protein
MPSTRSKSKQAKKRVNDSTTSSNVSESAVVDRGEQDSLDTQGQMQHNLSDAEQVPGLETDRIDSSDTGSSNEQISSQQSQNPSQSSFDHATNVQKNVIMVEVDGVSIPMSVQDFLNFRQMEKVKQNWI